MNWKLVVAVGTAVGTVVWAARHKLAQDGSDGDAWAAVTDPITGS